MAEDGYQKGVKIDRRTLLVGGGAGVGLLLAWSAWPRAYRHNLDAAPGETIVNAFLKIGEDGHVTVVVPQAEMGQGVWTALPQILADELGADWRTVGVEPAPINPLYANDLLAQEEASERLPDFLSGVGNWAAREYATRSALMITGGSTSVRGFEARYREAGATARALLCMAAGQRWNADWQACDTNAGFVVHGEDRLRFGALAVHAATLSPPSGVQLRAIGDGGISGRPMPRIDLPAKVDGSARYAGDVRLPDMVFASVRHGPYGASKLVRTTPGAARDLPGVIGIFENPGWAAVAATNWWAAERGVALLNPTFATEGQLPDDASIAAALDKALAADGTRLAAIGDTDQAFQPAGLIEARYAVPFQAHSPMEPLTATARITGDRIEVWMPTQAPGLARAAIARTIEFAESEVTVYPMLGGGGFGRKLENDAACQAAILTRKLGRPVQLSWSRAEEITRCRFRPPAVARMAARLGTSGTLQAWRTQIAAPAAERQTMARLMPDLPGVDNDGAEHAAVAGAVPPYAVPVLAIDHHPVTLPIPTGIWRSAAHSYTAFFNEAFMDELAGHAGIEPLSFRIQALGGNRRLAHCLQTATALGNWNGGAEGSGQGIAAHSCYGSHVAMLIEAHVGTDQRTVVDRVVAVVDCGRVINPDLVRQQVEGGILWGMAAALGGAIRFAAGIASPRNFDGLDLPTLVDTPDIQVELVRSSEAPGGVSDIAVPPVAPAIANALFTVTGKRLRTLPLRVGGA